MLSYLQLWESTFGPLRLFQFISVRAILAGITALVIGFLIGPKVIRFLQNFGGFTNLNFHASKSIIRKKIMGERG